MNVRKVIKRILGMILALVLMISSSNITAYALTINDSGDVDLIDVEWQSPTEIVKVETKEKQFIVSTKTEKGRVNNFIFEFPTQGGVRFHADQTGFWNAEEYNVITYSASEHATSLLLNGETIPHVSEMNVFPASLVTSQFRKSLAICCFSADVFSLPSM